MTYVVVESCIKCKYTDCVDVCPVDCFHEGPNMLVIDPDECIGPIINQYRGFGLEHLRLKRVVAYVVDNSTHQI